MRPMPATLLLLALLLPAPARAQEPNAVGAGYGANLGWLLWGQREGDPAVFGENVASGFVYLANAGWVHLGDGTPLFGSYYTNSLAQDYGININATSDPDYYLLEGLAWSANLGWINFDVGGTVAANQTPRVSKNDFTLSGWAWCPNAGWIELGGNGLGAARILFEIPTRARQWMLYE